MDRPFAQRVRLRWERGVVQVVAARTAKWEDPMNPAVSRWRLLRTGSVIALCAVTLSACVSEYGGSALYLGKTDDRIGVVVPANAPSIRQQFRVGALPGEDKSTAYSHEGIDIVAPLGTPVIAAAPGTVISSLDEPVYGNQIVVDHGADAAGRHMFTVYKHLDKRLARVGDKVARGQQIGTLGRTGVAAAGILHLHFEVRKGARLNGSAPFDPNRFWVAGAGRITCFDPSETIDESAFRASYPVICKGG